MIIGGRHIGPGHEPYVIAEIGVNHDGSVERALELVDAAADAGADAVKTQFFRAELLLSKAARLAAYQQSAGERDPMEMLMRLELDSSDILTITERAKERGLASIVTVFTEELVDEIDRIPPDAYKIASPDIINRPLLEKMASTGRPLIVSTGASTMDEVRRAAGWLKGARKNKRLALLQCVSCYPVDVRDAALDGVLMLWREFGDPVGYSDHTTSTSLGYEVVRSRGLIVEKHLTYDRSAQGPDHAASLDPEQFKTYCALTKSVMTDSLGMSETMGPIDGHKRVLDCELDVRTNSRQSVVSRRAIASGETLALEDLAIKRPGSGIEPWRLSEMLGRPAARDIAQDTPIQWEDVA